MNFRTLLIAISLTLFLVPSVFRSQEKRRQPLSPAQQSEAERRQVEHSKLYLKYAGIGDLRSVVAESGGDVEVLNGTGQKIFFPNTPPIQFEDFVAAIARQADAIIIGVVNEQKSFLTAEGTFVFTDYSLKVERILKENPADVIRPLDDIVVTRPGGEMRLSGRNIRASDESLAPFETGKRYLLFLDYIPSTEAYKAFNSSGAFRIDGGRTTKLTKDQLPPEFENGADLSTVVAYVKAALH